MNNLRIDIPLHVTYYCQGIGNNYNSPSFVHPHTRIGCLVAGTPNTPGHVCVSSKFIYLPNLFVRMSYETNKLECNDNKLQYTTLYLAFGVYECVCKNKRRNQATLQCTVYTHRTFGGANWALSAGKEQQKELGNQQRRRHGTKAHIWDDIK